MRDPDGKLQTSTLLSTDLALSAEQIIGYFVRPRTIEVTFGQARAHPGVETQRQWSVSEDVQPISFKAIARITPVLPGLFSVITLIAHRLDKQGKLQVSTAAWYEKKHPAFADVIASVRQLIWQESSFSMSASREEMIKLPRGQLLVFQQALA